MSLTFRHNPLIDSAPVQDIVYGVVFREKDHNFEIHKALSLEPATDGAIGWVELHYENQDAFLEFMQQDLDNAQSDLDQAIKKDDPQDERSKLQEQVADRENKLHLAIDLTHELRVEAAELRLRGNQGDTPLRLTEGSLSETSIPEFYLHTVYDWLADSRGIEIPEWRRPGACRPRRAREHSTKLLSIMDSTIEEFYEGANYNPDHPPLNVVIDKWLEVTYPNDYGIILSKKVIEAMCKMMKPDK